MKKLLALIVLALLVSGALFAQISRGGTAWVAAKTVTLKSSTWFFAGSKGTLSLGDQVTVLQVNGSWAEVRSAANSSLNGWTQVSNLSARRIVSTGTTASATEVAMAGKGFNQEVENAYINESHLNYADVDRTEAITVSVDELFQFVKEGRLFAGE
ncbi:MAG: hypothetical protein LBH42_02765 [Treponema sp.]|nr:hypothetical protein [Treponema sp.]